MSRCHNIYPLNQIGPIYIIPCRFRAFFSISRSRGLFCGITAEIYSALKVITAGGKIKNDSASGMGIECIEVE